MSYNEKRELKGLPPQIEKFEAQQNELLEIMSSPGFFKKDSQEIAQTKAKLELVEDELLKAYERWEYLEDLKGEKG